MAKRTSARKKAARGRKATRIMSSKKPAAKAEEMVRKHGTPSPQAAPDRGIPRPLRSVPAASASGRTKPGIYAQLMRDRRALRIASIILGIIALLHLVRFVTGFTVIVDDVVLPITASGFIVVIFGVLAVWYYRLSLD